ncbi:CYTH domain-containing protein [Candidatus Dojkabacteria bacterium]|nr:CYTH domain-containing protein [Candidatus Dojkabacteria bacterium]
MPTVKREIEIELRYEILDNEPPKLNYTSPRRVLDVYYDTANGKFFKQGIFIRERNNKKLDFKFNLEDLKGNDLKNDHTHCDDFSFTLPLTLESKKKIDQVGKILKLKIPKDFNLTNFLNSNSLRKLAVVDKLRRKANQNGFSICYDVEKTSGRFLEIEKCIEIDSDANDYREKIQQIKDDIASFVKSFGVGLKQNPIGYCEAVLRKTNFDLYLQGKYVLGEDKIA